MKTAKRLAKENHIHSPGRQDWDFGEVPNFALLACCYWEYARESEFIRNTLQSYREWWLAGAKREESTDALFARTDRIQSIGARANVFLSGCSFKPGTVWQSIDPEREDYRHPEAPPITGSFPDPWQTLSPPERTYRSRLVIYGDGPKPEPIERGDGYEAEDIARFYRSTQNEAFKGYLDVQRQNRGKSEIQLIAEGKLKPLENVLPSLYWESGREVTVLRIAWSDYTNDELALAFRRWVKENRPHRCPVPSDKGRKPGDLRAQLTRLAVMRLLSNFRTSEILNPRAHLSHGILETKQFSGKKWFDATKWHDARREAGKFFRLLFPFLPTAEKPLSWERKQPGK